MVLCWPYVREAWTVLDSSLVVCYPSDCYHEAKLGSDVLENIAVVFRIINCRQRSPISALASKQRTGLDRLIR
jgi:hypothetical protein